MLWTFSDIRTGRVPPVNSKTWSLQVIWGGPDRPISSLPRGRMVVWQLASALIAFLAFPGDAVPNAGRGLLQSTLAIDPSDPISATTDELVNDPQGRGHLLVRSRFCIVRQYLYSTTWTNGPLSDPRRGP